MKSPAAFALIALAALCLLAATVLAMSGHDSPAWFAQLAFLAAGGGAGVANPAPTDPDPPASPPRPVPPT